MKYIYEYKHKEGCIVSGCDLESIDFLDDSIFTNYIRLQCVDTIQTNNGCNIKRCSTLLNMNEIEYLKTSPMKGGCDE